ncbi:DUF6520 family protein [Pedobacter panaciterrae]|uniref:DUF6520 family protein n=1 Tax=Pedobacter panaciterrae TaxID=363849 RepID=A0ABU8NHL3_9SPHI
MKNLQKIAVALLVGIMAIGFTAFTNASTKRVPSWVYVQTDADLYTRISFSTYDESNCQNSSTRECSFTQPESDGSNHGPTLSYSQVQALNFPASTSEGIYIP